MLHQLLFLGGVLSPEDKRPLPSPCNVRHSRSSLRVAQSTSTVAMFSLAFITLAVSAALSLATHAKRAPALEVSLTGMPSPHDMRRSLPTGYMTDSPGQRQLHRRHQGHRCCYQHGLRGSQGPQVRHRSGQRDPDPLVHGQPGWCHGRLHRCQAPARHRLPRRLRLHGDPRRRDHSRRAPGWVSATSCLLFIHADPLSLQSPRSTTSRSSARVHSSSSR